MLTWRPLRAAVRPPVAAAVGDQGYGPTSAEAVSEDLRALGYRNGNMPSTRLLEVDGCLLERDAAYTLSLMLEAARTDGVALYAQECYRSLDSQAAAYERRCPIVEEEITKIDPATGEPFHHGVEVRGQEPDATTSLLGGHGRRHAQLTRAPSTLGKHRAQSDAEAHGMRRREQLLRRRGTTGLT